MNFNTIIEYRKKYPIFKGNKDALCNAIIEGSYNYDYALLPMSVIEKNADVLFKEKYCDVIIQIPSPFSWIDINFIILHFTNKKPSNLLTGIFKGREYEKQSEKPTEDFSDFLNNIYSFVNDESITRDDLTINDYSIFDPNNLNPLYYTKQAIKIRKELQESDYKLLKDISNIITAPTHQDIKGKCIYAKHFEYPLKYNELPIDNIHRAIKVEKGDIICLLLGDEPKFYLYNEDYKDVYINASIYCIIRVNRKEINNYLINYLADEKARIYFSYTKRGSVIPFVNRKDFAELKVILPTKEMIKIANELMEYKMNLKKTSLIEINAIIRQSYKLEFKNESQKMINDDMLNAISKIKNQAIRELINDDLKEVETCFDNKAYKSAIILCGSILEAILLDWLSEYENTNDILNVAKSEDGRDLELSKIISKLKELVRPYWYESSKAHEIRKTRNMVHPKECIKNKTKVSVDECRKIIDNLTDIIESKDCRN